MKKYLSVIAMMLALTCTVTACGANKNSDVSSKENVSESMSELADSSDKAVYDTYEEALAAYYEYVAAKDYDAALSVMLPESVCSLIKYMKSEDEIVEECFYDWWDINKKLYFDEVVSEIQMDDAEKQQYCNEINAELYCNLQISEKYEQFPPAEKLEEEISELYDQVWITPQQTNCPNYISDIRNVKVHLTTTHDVDIYHTAFVYLIDGEGWRVIRIEDDPKEEWEKKITSIADMGDSVWTSSLDLVNEYIAENKFGLAEKDWTKPCAISTVPDFCYNFDKEAALEFCEDIYSDIDGAEKYDFFIAFSGSTMTDIIICSKDDHKNICITPSGSIDIGDEYENASDLTFEKACQLYLENFSS